MVGSAQATPTGTQSVYPTQDIRPELSTAIPITTAWLGGVADGQATATGRGQTTATKTSEQEAVYTAIRANQEQLKDLTKLVTDMLAARGAVVTPPAVTPPVEPPAEPIAPADPE